MSAKVYTSAFAHNAECVCLQSVQACADDALGTLDIYSVN